MSYPMEEDFRREMGKCGSSLEARLHLYLSFHLPALGLGRGGFLDSDWENGLGRGMGSRES